MGDYAGLSGGLKVIIRIFISGDNRQESQCQSSRTREVIHGPAIWGRLQNEEKVAGTQVSCDFF
jgi:hypothetical protein